jgi:hypothetical protein
MDALGKIFFLALGINGVHELPAGEDEHGEVLSYNTRTCRSTKISITKWSSSHSVLELYFVRGHLFEKILCIIIYRSNARACIMGESIDIHVQSLRERVYSPALLLPKYVHCATRMTREENASHGRHEDAPVRHLSQVVKIYWAD